MGTVLPDPRKRRERTEVKVFLGKVLELLSKRRISLTLKVEHCQCQPLNQALINKELLCKY